MVKRSGTPTTRRKFIGDSLGVLGAGSVLGLLLAANARVAEALPAWALRPPGALPEADFAAACLRCGLCVQACPYDILHLAGLGDGVTPGTPYFVARQRACEMCVDIPCAVACPTDALTAPAPGIAAARMGLARMTGPDTCYSINGTAQCGACYLACPVKDAAITMERRSAGGRVYFEPTVNAAHCTGCGKCEAACVTEEASIKVLPLALARQDRLGPLPRRAG